MNDWNQTVYRALHSMSHGENNILTSVNQQSTFTVPITSGMKMNHLTMHNTFKSKNKI